MLIYFIIVSLVLYISSVFISIVFFRTDFKQSLKEIVVSGLFYVAILTLAYWVFYGLISGSQSYYPIFISVPIFFAIFSSYSYLIFPTLLYFFRKKKQTHDYDRFLSDAGITAKVIRVKNLDNAYAMGLLSGTHTIIIGEDLINRMTPIQISGVILHEIAHLKKGHLLVLWLIELIGIYFFMTSVMLVNAYISDNIIINIIFFGLLGLTSQFLKFPMKYFEKRADIYAVEHTGKKEYISALKILYGDKKDTWNFEHPKLSQRIKYIEDRC